MCDNACVWKEYLRKANVDVDGAIQRFSNKENRYIKYLRLFEKDTNFNNLLIALERESCNEAFEYCHSLKGVVGNLGFNTMYPNIYEACEILRSGRLEGVKELIDGITDNYNEIIKIISEYLA